MFCHYNKASVYIFLCKIKGPDIPSSNLIADKGKKINKIPTFKQHSKMTAVPDIPLKMKQDPTQMLYKMAIVNLLFF